LKYVKKRGVGMKKMVTETTSLEKISQKLEKLNNEAQKKGVFSGFISA
jgi:hypothetical protein